jgi:hypothetical protein
MVADYVAERGATKIIVNNGGDIAVRLREGEKATVGLRLDPATSNYDNTAVIDRDCGVCTSGVQGRSFTLGVADAVTVMADRAAVADAVATFLGNKTIVDSPKVIRVPAESMYPDTDLMGVTVTHSVGELSQSEISTAIKAGTIEALSLLKKSDIHGAVIAVKGHRNILGYFVKAIRRAGTSAISSGGCDYLPGPSYYFDGLKGTKSWA